MDPDKTAGKFHSGDLEKYSFLVTGGAGFIGSHITDYLVQNKAGHVTVLDSLVTGTIENISHHLKNPTFKFIKGDIEDLSLCRETIRGVDFVSHQAALGSVPRSINNPIATNQSNVTGFLNILTAAKEAGVKRLVFASSSSVYGDSQILPKKEEVIGRPLSPYAVTKLVDELYAEVFSRIYFMEIIGLRYFNIFGPRQNPNGPYAAAIPNFLQASIDNTKVKIFGDGNQTRDFTYINNAVKANILALFCKNPDATNSIYNIAVGESISLNKIIEIISEISGRSIDKIYENERAGDIRNSLADISKAATALNYSPEKSIYKGLKETFDWFLSNQKPAV